MRRITRGLEWFRGALGLESKRQTTARRENVTGAAGPLPFVPHYYRRRLVAAGLSRALAAEVITNREAKGRIVAQVRAQRDVNRGTHRDLLIEHEADAQTGQGVGLGTLNGLSTRAAVLDLQLAVLQTQACGRQDPHLPAGTHLGAQGQTEVQVGGR